MSSLPTNDTSYRTLSEWAADRADMRIVCACGRTFLRSESSSVSRATAKSGRRWFDCAASTAGGEVTPRCQKSKLFDVEG